MSSPSWEVRNSAALAFTELITRTLGFKNNLSGDSAKRAVTGSPFPSPPTTSRNHFLKKAESFVIYAINLTVLSILQNVCIYAEYESRELKTKLVKTIS
jgi:hypothetical protein